MASLEPLNADHSGVYRAVWLRVCSDATMFSAV